MDACTAAGLTPVYDTDGSGTIAYCQDAYGNVANVVDPNAPVVVSSPTGTTTVSPTPSSTLGLVSGLENDFLTAWQRITQPGLPPGQVGFSLGFGPAGGSLSGSPVILLFLLAMAFLLVEKEL